MKSWVAFGCAVAIAGCAATGASLPPDATRADVLAAMGPPAAEFPHPDGSRTLAYPHGPLGTQTFMADLGPDGRLRSLRQALTDDTFQQISPGMTRDDVLRLIGPPGDAMRFPNLDQDSWEWRFVDTWGYPAVFSVDFDRRGVVVSKFTRRIERDRNPFSIF